MKKMYVLTIISGMVLMFFGVSSFAAEGAALTVTAKSGKVLIRAYPAKIWTEVALGQAVHAKDAIKTDYCDIHSKDKNFVDNMGKMCEACGTATLELPDKSSVSVRPGTEMTVDEIVLTSTARSLKVNMTKGDLRMIATKVDTPSTFSVKTPNAAYNATGTVYYVKATPDGTSVYVADGSISVVNPIDGKTYTVTAGYIMTFNANGTFSGPSPASDIDVSTWMAYYTTVTVEPYTPPTADQNNVEPPNNTPERAVSGG